MAENNLCDSNNEVCIEEAGSTEGIKYNYGGITCCVPECYNNNKRNKDLSFYVIPADKTLRKKWLNAISRKDFKVTPYHRVCSAHFSGGRKTYLNNVKTFYHI